MTLKDFFTLTETKDGIAATSRVEELITVMQKENDSVVNPADAIREWTAVASIITRTGYKDCLDLFVQLGGLLFIDRWLKDAENFGSDNADNFVEESVTVLLLALERLCIDKDKSVSSGIWVTVSHLLDHHNARVQDRARAVFDNWNYGDRGNDAVCQQMEDSALANDWASVSKAVGNAGRQIGEAECSTASICSRGENEDVESNASEAMSIDNLPLKSSNATIPERVEDVQKKHTPNLLRSKMVLETCNESFSSLLSSAALSGSDQGGNSDDMEDIHTCPEETTRVETCFSDVPLGNSFIKADTVPVNAMPEDMKPVDKLSSSQKNLSSLGATIASDLANVSEADALTSEQIAAVSSMGTNVAVDESNICSEPASVSDLQVSVAEPQMKMAEVPTGVEDSGCCLDTAKNSPDKKVVSEKLDDINESHSSEEVDAAAKCKETVRDRYKEVLNLGALYGGRRVIKQSYMVRSKKSSIQLEYGILDALDTACQVAEEVEREVTDYKEPFSNTSSERSSGGRIGDSRSSCSTDSSSGEVSTGQSQSAEGDRRSSTRSGNGDSETKDLVEDAVGSSRMTEVKVKTEKDFCEFDLNEEICSDVGGNKTLLGEEFHISSSQRLKCLEIDLNMAEDGEDVSESHVTGNIVPVSSDVNSKGSSVEANQVRSERFNLDLNSTGDDDDDGVVISISHHFNGHDSKSPASSSSQMQPHERSFDLNDQPCSSFNDSFSNQALYNNPPSTGSMSFGKSTLEPFISIMGTKVGISRDDLVPQRSSHLHNGKATFEPPSGGVLGLGPTVSSLYSPMTQCSTVPLEHTISFSLAPHRPSDRTHCVVDPWVGPMLPGALLPTQSQYPPYAVPFTTSLNTGSSQLQSDLNSGFTVDGANQDPHFLMQLFPPSHVKSATEYPSAFFRPFHGSIIGAKRKEPEDRLEPYPIVYGQHQSSWK